MLRWCGVILLMICSLWVNAQSFTFRLRKVPNLTMFLFAEGYEKSDLDTKLKEEVKFPDRMYIQLYDNDTFLIHWNQLELKDAISTLNYFERDSNTIVGWYDAKDVGGVRFKFPYKGKNYNMFAMRVEPLIQKKEYVLNPEDEDNKENRVQYYYEFDGKVNLLADFEKGTGDLEFEYDDIRNRSENITLGYFSDELYNEDADQNVPLNIVKTYPVEFIYENGFCDQNLFWSGVQSTKDLQPRDSTWFNDLPADNVIELEGSMLTYYSNRRYVYFPSDSQMVVTALNRDCDYIRQKADSLQANQEVVLSKQKDGIKNFLVKIPNQKNFYGWASTYGCAVEWKIFESRKITKWIEKEEDTVFKRLGFMKPISKAVLGDSCEPEKI